MKNFSHVLLASALCAGGAQAESVMPSFAGWYAGVSLGANYTNGKYDVSTQAKTLPSYLKDSNSTNNVLKDSIDYQAALNEKNKTEQESEAALKELNDLKELDDVEQNVMDEAEQKSDDAKKAFENAKEQLKNVKSTLLEDFNNSPLKDDENLGKFINNLENNPEISDEEIDAFKNFSSSLDNLTSAFTNSLRLSGSKTRPSFSTFAGYGFLNQNMYFGVEFSLGYDNSKVSLSKSYKDALLNANLNVNIKGGFTYGFAGRVGYVINPRILMYARAGLEGNQWKIERTANFKATIIEGAYSYKTSKTVNKLQFVPGVGFDILVTPKMLMRAEYSYNLGFKTKLDNGSESVKANQHSFKIGVAYKFN